jgi:hypothetical protein
LWWSFVGVFSFFHNVNDNRIPRQGEEHAKLAHAQPVGSIVKLLHVSHEPILQAGEPVVDRLLLPFGKGAQLELAIRRGELISKDLVTRQAAYLMVSLRQRLLNLPVHAHKLVGLDADQMRKALREIAIATLNEIKNLPSAVSDPNWLETLERDEGK